ncbi:hypothetical protein PUNSTDRAFT_136416 [Punctularia strigosozonata HHB-11173 SS5]|uniref:uncharacterized protein n=1 Tax=Punctularia strigosozonata (strain HHB-11173) TaxID=741275 RepID=UPI0004416D7E|nr:uncharacterized protein PUNSTDRAFT_136416 [Punctularia strigosozonata HHB-11173 SS5]EIN06565.1 hypothetical protein PUNSTDRAFT_136416 [Punctularia strigosozonata HHB-11173 SS5]
MFVLFTIISVTALAAPSLLRQAWPNDGAVITQPWRVTLDAFSPPRYNTIDGASQMAAGEGSWTTGLSAAEIYNSSTFVPATSLTTSESTFQQYGEDYFFAAANEYLVVPHMPGVRVTGSCWTTPSPPLANDTHPALANWCDSNNLDQFKSDTSLLAGNVAFNITWCSDFYVDSATGHRTDWMNNVPSSTANVVAHISVTDGNESGGAHGFIRCNYTFATGNATVGNMLDAFNTSNTYRDFQQLP